MNEKKMSDRIFRNCGRSSGKKNQRRRYAAREVTITVLGGSADANGDWLDIVEYDKEERTFSIVELKAGRRSATVRTAFRQVEKYRQTLQDQAHVFVNAFTRKSPLAFNRVMEATSGGRNISLKFYVGLRDAACENLNLLRSLKEQYPDTGIIRVKDDGRIRRYVKSEKGTRDYHLTEARPVSFAIAWPLGAVALDNTIPSSGAAA